MKKECVISKIKKCGFIAVIRAGSADEAKKIIADCIEGGVKVIELTFTVPYAHKVLEEVSREYGDQIIIGAGTVLDSETARIAILSGAQFIVSPAFNADTVKLCNRYRITSMAGIMTINEAITALEAGTDILKLFPGEISGPAFIKAIKGPLPQADIMPTGGVTTSNVGEWIKAGAVALGAGSSLTKGNIKENAQAFIKGIEEARNELK